MRYGLHDPKYLYSRKGNNKFKGPVLMRKCESSLLLKFNNSFWNMLLPMLSAEWLNVLYAYFSKEYHNSRHNG